MASIRLKPNSKHYYACYTDAEGRQRQRSTGLTDRRKAMKFAEELEQGHRQRISENAARRAFEHLIQELHGTTGTLAMATDKALELWLEGKRVEATPATARRYDAALRSFREWLGDKASADLSTITTATLERFRNDLAATRSAGTVNLTLKTIKAVMEFAVERGWLSENPATRIRAVKKRSDAQGRRPFTVEELQKILAASGDEWRGMVLAGLYTGQRLGDIARLRWSHVDLVQGEIAFNTAKTGRRVIIPICEPLARMIEQLPAGEDPEAPLFPESFATVERSQTGSLSNQFYRIMTAAGLVEPRSHHKAKDGRAAVREGPSLGFHCLRYTATSMMKNAGISASVVMDIVGHDSEAVSRAYTKIETESKRSALAAMPDLTKGTK